MTKETLARRAAATRKWRANNPDAARATGRMSEHRRRLKMYGLSHEAYDALLVKQGGVCAICHRPETTTSQTGRVFALALDHYHATGKVRGLLCAACNIMLGKADDSADRLRAGAAYRDSYR